jgi:hypothetical protein
VVTNAYGSVTSQVATLTFTLPATPPQIVVGDSGWGFTTNQFGFGFNVRSAVGQTVIVEGSTNLTDWTPIFTNIFESGGSFQFSDPAWTNFQGRFYRARLP